jgi:hypothetical protein
MAQSNAAFALLTLGQWCRSHGIYEIRDTLAKAAYLAEGVESSELLAAALEEASIAADVVVCPAPTTEPSPVVVTPPADATEPAAGKGKRRAHVDGGHSRGGDPATPTANEAGEGE